jgi:hypothetical protein
MADERDKGPSIPRSTDEETVTEENVTEEENVVIDTTSTEPLRKAKIEEPSDDPREPRNPAHPREPANPPRTTEGIFTSPKFGSAGSGGAELEPGPERD